MLKGAALLEFSEHHLYYEIDMVYRAAALLATDLGGGSINNAVVESYALHLRNLIEFLYLPRRHDDDVRAADYLGDWNMETPPPTLADAKARADKQVAHLTEKRFRDGAVEKLWKPGEELPPLVTTLRQFLGRTDPALMHHRVKAATERLGAILEYRR